MTARAYVGAVSYERARLVRARVCLRDDCPVVERMGGSAGKKIPRPGYREGILEEAMPHAPRLAKESS